MLSIIIPSIEQQTCHFTVTPSTYNHFSTETPCYSPTLSPTESYTDPTHPLLALREPPIPSHPSSIRTSTSSTFLQMQTTAAYPDSPSRPQPSPVQNVPHRTSDDSSSSYSSTSSIDSSMLFVDLARCSRCQRTPSVDVKTGKSNMVQYGLNLWYCSRCASMVGLTNR